MNMATTLSQAQLMTIEDELKKLQEEIVFTPEALPKEKLILAILNRVPMLVELLNTIDNTSMAMGQIAQFVGNTSKLLTNTVNGLAYTGIVLDGINFIRIPLIYIAAYAVGEKPPIKLSNNAKWLYAATLFALGITAVAVPTAAIGIGVTTAFLVGGMSTYSLGRLLWQRYQTKKEIKALNREIALETTALEVLQQEAQLLEEELKNGGDRTLVSTKMADLKSRLDEQKEKMQLLYNNRLLAQKSLKKKDWGKVVDKSIGLILSAGAIAAAITAIFFPTVALVVLASIGIVGLSYVGMRMFSPLIIKAGQWLLNKFNPQPPVLITDSSAQVTLTVSSVNTLSSSVQTDPLDPGIAPSPPLKESTSKAVTMLFRDDAKKALQGSIQLTHSMDIIESIMTDCLQTQNHIGILDLFKTIMSKNHAITEMDVINLLELTNDRQGICSLFAHAVEKVRNKEIDYPKEDIEQLLLSNAFTSLLHAAQTTLSANSKPLFQPAAATSKQLIFDEPPVPSDEEDSDGDNASLSG